MDAFVSGTDIYITDLETDYKLRFPMLPEIISVKAGAAFQNYNLMAIGEIKFPYGENLTSFTWKGILPGKAREKEPYVKDWLDPISVQSLWSVYRANRKKLRLLITQTPINHDVYLDNYSVDYANGYGDYSYQITFIQAKELKISTVDDTDGVAAALLASVTSVAAASNVEGEAGMITYSKDKNHGMLRPAPPASTTYTVKEGDTLWSIAQSQLGDGGKYSELHSANQALIGSNPHAISPGQVLRLP